MRKYPVFRSLWPGRSQYRQLAWLNLQYLGGMDGLNTFPAKCRYLGMFEEIDDPARGGPVLRDPATIDPVGLWTGKQYLEVVSGPLR